MSMSKNSNPGRWDHLLREIPFEGSASQTNPTSPSAKTSVKETKLAKAPHPANSAPLVIDSIDEPTILAEEIEIQNNELHIVSVSDINSAIKNKLEGEFSLLWVQGEISNFKAHTSGHYYFSLKDDKAQISCVMFKGFNSRLPFQPESGMEVVVRGKVTVYEPRGNYQIFCEFMEPVGAGALQKAFEQLKEKLNKEGLFDPQHKKALPPLPQRVAVVTSPTGAAIQDILNILKRRSRRVQVTVIPARVQGEGSAQEVVRGIELANRLNCYDVLIVGRGGGSIEDLWAFNEESVARAVFASKIPVISAVGHEIDFTISDFVADMRAPTPSAAAEIVAQSEQELIDKIKFFSKSIRLMIYQQINEHTKRLQFLNKSLLDPRRTLQDKMLRLDELGLRLHQSVIRALQNKRIQVQMRRKSLADPRHTLEKTKLRYQSLDKTFKRLTLEAIDDQKLRLKSILAMLDSLSPLRVVDRGFAIVRSKSKLVADIDQLKDNEIEVELRDGFLSATVHTKKKKERT